MRPVRLPEFSSSNATGGGPKVGKGVAKFPEIYRDFRLEHQIDRNAFVEPYAFRLPFQLAAGLLRNDAGYREVEIGPAANAVFRVRTERDKIQAQRFGEAR